MKKFLKAKLEMIGGVFNSKLEKDIFELNWANIYHDTSKGKNWLQDLSISPYDMAINYSMLYILTRIFSDFKIRSVLEFGLGESSKFINSYAEFNSKELQHIVVEHDQNWIDFYKKNVSGLCEIKCLDLVNISINECSIKTYKKLDTIGNVNNFDLYIIDGPLGLPNYSRYDICLIAQKFRENDEFLIVIDDFQRKGEKDTYSHLIRILKEKNLNTYTKEFVSIKNQLLIATEKYKFATTF